MRLIFCGILFFSINSLLFSQSIVVSFVGTGKAKKIDSVKVINFDAKHIHKFVNVNEIVLEQGQSREKKINENARKIFLNQNNVLKYKKGQLLFIEAFSSNMATVVPLVPRKDTMIEFYFDECIDAEGNSYAIMKVCDILWMVDNLRVTKTNDNKIIKYGKGNWHLNEPLFREVFDLEKYSKFYGLLYNWYAATSDILPKGWKLPSIEDWNKFEKCTMFGKNAVGNRLKELRFIPAGYCDVSGEFMATGEKGYWWLSDEYDDAKAWYFMLNNQDASVGLNFCDKKHGFSVRGVKYLK